MHSVAILAFRESGPDELHRLATLDRKLANEYAEAVQALLQSAAFGAAAVTAIGCHGQTLRHHPQGDAPYTLQIGDPNRLAERTGITVVADFRRRDMAAGGQGAPLVPAFHQARLVSPGVPSGIANIGGIANITLVSAEGDISGWDTGPGNTLMDGWIAHHQGVPFDRDGAWAASGTVIESLLQSRLKTPTCKSAQKHGTRGRHLDWLTQHLSGTEAPEDVQRTLVELTVESLARGLEQAPVEVVRVCGGGARNALLLERLDQRLEHFEVTTTEAIGVDPQWVEAWAFAWLAEQTLAGLPGNVGGDWGSGRQSAGRHFPRLSARRLTQGGMTAAPFKG